MGRHCATAPGAIAVLVVMLTLAGCNIGGSDEQDQSAERAQPPIGGELERALVGLSRYPRIESARCGKPPEQAESPDRLSELKLVCPLERGSASGDYDAQVLPNGCFVVKREESRYDTIDACGDLDLLHAILATSESDPRVAPGCAARPPRRGLR